MNAEQYFDDQAATLGDRLTAARENQDLTQTTLAKRLGVKKTTIAKWENDVSEPRANRLTMLSGILNVSIRWLLTGEGEGVSPVDYSGQTDLAHDADSLIRDLKQIEMKHTQIAADIASLIEKLSKHKNNVENENS